MCMSRQRVHILYIATGKYIAFWPIFHREASIRLFPDAEKRYFLFTDSTEYESSESVTVVPTEHRPWPRPTLDRFRHMIDSYEQWKDAELALFINANAVPCSPFFFHEVFPYVGSLVACVHPCAGRMFSTCSLETRPECCAYTQERTPYVCGGFQGGKPTAWLEACKVMQEWTEEDEKNGIMPVWHDESYWNKYCLMKKKEVRLLGWPTVYVEPHPWVKIYLLEKAAFFRDQNFREEGKDQASL